MQLNLLVSCLSLVWFIKENYRKMEIGLLQVVLYLYNVYLENKDSDNCAQLLEKEFNKIYGIKTLDDGHD